jgi:hypothetical protein
MACEVSIALNLIRRRERPGHELIYKSRQRVQIGLSYQLEHNSEDFERMEDARGHINAVIGAWCEKHGLTHSAPLQPGFLLSGAGGMARQG